MVVSKNYGVNGKFKFDVYTKDNELKYTTDYIDNFITPTGLEYIKYVGFADCFRYVSLGTGTGLNSITSNGGLGTTGLHSGITQFSYIGGNTESSPCAEAGSNQYISKSCGYRFDPTGVTLSRAWRIPVATDEYFSKQWVFKEYMITPGTTGVYGYLYDVNLGTFNLGTGCSCSEPVYEADLSTVKGYGKEAPDFVESYPFICGFSKAFTRIVKSLTVEANEYLVVNYALTVNLQNATGVRKFDVTVDRTDSEDGTSYNWVRATGVSSLVQPGIKLINNGDVTSVSTASQINGNYQFRGGESFVPPMGMAMEPSCPVANRAAYISSDNLQFKVNDLSGGAIDVDAFKPYNPAGRNFSSGVIGYHKSYITEVSNGTATLGDRLTEFGWCYNPRTRRESTFWPSQADFRNVAYYSELTDTIENNETFTTQFIPYHETPSAAKTSVVNQSAVISGRSRVQTTSFQFYPAEGSLYDDGTPARAFVYAYKPTEESTEYLPTLDSIIAPVKTAFTGTINTTSFTYGNPIGYIESDAGAGHYWTHPENILFMQLRLTWSSPCPVGVVGC